MKYIIQLSGLLSLSLFLITSCGSPTIQDLPENSSKAQSIKDAIEFEREITMDPATGEVPRERLYQAWKYTRQLQKEIQSQQRSLSADALVNANWDDRGPNNIGGRTRAIHIDLSDPERKKVWVGGVSGGLWSTEDITQSDPEWKLADDFLPSLSIGGIAQDPNNTDIMYASTGEGYTGDTRGAGIFKSIDGGETWEVLPATVGTITFRYVQEILVRDNGDVYAATWDRGVRRSSDGGATWQTSLSTSNATRINDLIFTSDGRIVASTRSTVFISSTGDSNDWENIGTGRAGFPNGLVRCEVAVCETDPNIMYIIGNLPVGGSSAASNVYETRDGGQTWIERAQPTFNSGQEFTRGQAWYDLEIGVDPFNCSVLFAGGVPLARSAFQALNWDLVGGLHVDQHAHVFDTEQNGVIYFGNDGGIWRTANGGATIQSKNRGYVTTQFYACALHPEAGSNYMLGGTQDNNSLQLDQDGLGPANVVLGGDGVYCFIDQDDPDVQIVSSQFGNYSATNNSFQSYSGSASVNGSFINRSDYDDDANILYGQTGGADFFRWNLNTFELDFVNAPGINSNPRAVKADPNVDNQIYIGSGTAFMRVTNAHDDDLVQGETLNVFPGGGSISCIYLDKLSADDILVTFANYGLTNKVYISRNGGNSFTPISGNLPDMPVRWAMFDPADHNRAIIATDLGVWCTENIAGASTEWLPTDPDGGLPTVRTDMLQLRESDNVVLAGTYGRGLWTSSIFAVARPVAKLPRISYVGQDFIADGASSVKAESYSWDFGNGVVIDESVVNYSYNTPGRYSITLTINNELSVTEEILVLPTLGLPYTKESTEYGGGFESNEDHFAAFAESGTGFERGNSTITGKNGTADGANAFVLGLNDDEYLPNSEAYIYTPGYDFTDNTLYTLSFSARYVLQNIFDGFKLEYTTDYGETWRQLGNQSDPGWYNYLNQNVDRGVFLIGESYFTNIVPAFTEFSLDVSEFANRDFVAFRFVFKSDEDTENVGIAIDDFRILKFDGIPETRIVNQSAAYTGDSEVTINFSSLPEFQAERFEIERSVNGINWEVIRNIPASGKVTQIQQNYTETISELRPLLFYRIHSINRNDAIDYQYDFYSDIMVVSRNVDENKVNQVFPNPFTDQIYVGFTNIIEETVEIKLFDMAGRLVKDFTGEPNEVFVRLSDLNLIQGVYVLNIKIGDREDETYQMFSGN